MALELRGAVVESWDRFDPHHLFGVKPGLTSPVADTAPAIAPSAGPGLLEHNIERPWHPDSPFFWFGLVLAATAGLIGASTSIRVGPFRAAVQAGDT